jgi:vancomycin resistance protein YoaR
MDQVKARQYAAQLGLTPQRIQALQSLPSFDEASRSLEVLKKEARAQYRKLVFQYHPDRNPGNVSASETLRDLGEVMRHIEALNIQQRVPQPVMQIHFVQVQHQPVTVHVRTAPSYNTSTAGTTTSTYHAPRVAFIRPV